MAKKNSASQVAIWIILLLLIVGLAGFGATNFGGSVNSVGSVGDREIGVNRYARELQGEIDRLSQQFGTNITFSQAQTFGIDRAVLQRILSTVALENEATALGISAGDDKVRDQLMAIPSFQGVDGQFDREGYRFALERAGMSEATYEEVLRYDLARGILQAAVTGAAAMPQSYADTILSYAREKRDFTWAVLTPDDLETPIVDPSEDDLRAWWQANEDAFMLPETRDVAYAWITPETIAGTIEGDDEALRRLYDERADEYNQPERRLVERLVFASTEDAQAALDAIVAGESSFEDLVAERDLDLSDIDLGDVSRDELGAAADAVFALDEPGIAGPVETDLGAALFRMNGILPAQVIPFEEAREQLLGEYRTDAARRAITNMIDGIDDLLAGGATLEEIADETEMEAGRIAWSEGATEGIAAYPEFRETVTGTSEGDFPEIVEATDGTIFALRVDEVIAPRVEPFEDARPAVEAEWRRAQTVAALSEQATDVAALLEQQAETPDAETPEQDGPAESDDAAEDDAAPDEPAEDASAPDDTASDDTASDDTASGDTASEEVTSEEAASDETGPDAADADAAASDDVAGDDTAQTEGSDELAAATDTEADTAPDVAPDMATDTETDAETDPADTPDVAFTTETDIGRDGFVPDVPDDFIDQVFDMDSAGDTRIIEGAQSVYIVRLDAITPPDLSAPGIEAQADTLLDNTAQAIGSDMLDAYAAAIQAQAGITLNQPALNAVHSQFTQ